MQRVNTHARHQVPPEGKTGRIAFRVLGEEGRRAPAGEACAHGLKEGQRLKVRLHEKDKSLI